MSASTEFAISLPFLGYKQRNAALDTVFYDTKRLSLEERAKLTPLADREGSIIVVPPPSCSPATRTHCASRMVLMPSVGAVTVGPPSKMSMKQSQANPSFSSILSAARPVAVITGASAGIGAELARQFAQGGNDLVLVARRKDKLTELAYSLASAHGVTVEVVALDLAAPNAGQALANELATA